MTTRPEVVVVGAGGHAKVVISTLAAAGHNVSYVLDDNSALWGVSVLGIPVRGGIAELDHLVDGAAVIAIGDNAVRRRTVERFPRIQWPAVVHPAAYVDSTVRLGAGSVVFAGAVIQPDAVIGEHVIINTGATVDHDCRVGNFVHLAPGVHLAGGVWVGEGAFLGVGSVAIPNRVIGDWTIVGAGGVVIHDLAPGITAVGTPAVPLIKN